MRKHYRVVETSEGPGVRHHPECVPGSLCLCLLVFVRFSRSRPSDQLQVQILGGDLRKHW